MNFEIPSAVRELGFDAWFEQRLDPALSAHSLARVVSVHKNSWTVTQGQAACPAELTGKLLYATESAADLPTTGDWVYVDFYDDDTHAIVHEVMPRRSLLKRKIAGKRVDVQLIAANVDTAFLVQAVDANFNLRRLERYLVMVGESGAQAVILLSKADLATDAELTQITDSARAIAAEAQVLPISTQSGLNMAELESLLASGRSYCLLGSSGVGKTTLLNHFVGHSQFATKAVDGDSKGRHTTTSRELIRLPGGALLIDTPGMRELGSLGVEAGIEESFADITDLASRCEYSNCNHAEEPGCAVQAAIEAGELDSGRYRNYLKIQRESAFNEMSYQQKRSRDKRFGKLIKSALKDKGARRG